MAILKRINARARQEINTGFGANNSNYGGRFLNKDGKPNIKTTGVPLLDRISIYHTMLQLPRWKFFLFVVLFFIIMNLLFAAVYMMIGVENLGGMNAITPLEKFGEAYFFSAQTFTTVGYGRISPNGFLTSAVAAFEALIGLLSFALATGLFYGRFSRPKAYLRFSENMLLAPYNDGTALMLRMSPYKNTNLSDAEVTLTAGLVLEENGQLKNKFFTLALEYNKINTLTLSWTIVHPINEDSPFFQFTKEDFLQTKGEIMVYVKAFDDMFSNTVITRTSYTMNELLLGAKFIPMFKRNEEDQMTELDLTKLNAHTAVEISLPLKETLTN